MGEDGSVVGDRGANEDGTGLEAWEHQPTEDPVDYHVFELYCQMGYSRTVRAAAEKYFVEIKQPCPSGYKSRFTDVATRWSWQRRADAYWKLERRRSEFRIQELRDEALRRYAVLADSGLAKLEEALSRLDVGLSPKKLSPLNTGAAMRNIADAAAKFLEIHRIGLGDAEDDRKRRGRPPEDDGSDGGALPAIDDRLKPPEEK
jgi:hypothetical protein